MCALGRHIWTRIRPLSHCRVLESHIRRPLPHLRPRNMATEAQPVTIESPPAHNQLLEHEGKVYNTIKEGNAYIMVPPGAKTATDPKAAKGDSAQNAQQVFYNPIQQFNRDLSVLTVRVFAEDFAARRSAKAEAKTAQLQKKRKRKQNDRATEASVAASENDDASASKQGQPTNAAPSVVIGHTDQTPSLPEAGNGDGTGLAAQLNGSAEHAAKRQKLDPAHAELPQTTLVADTTAASTGTEAAVSAGDEKRPDDYKRSTLRILDALSATGLRALRYASELPLPTFVVANDLLPSATAATNLNVRHNRLTHQIQAVTSNAQAHMYSAAFAQAGHTYGKYDVIDLDPYGSAVPFIEAAVLAVNDGGMLCVTCTDAGVFNSLGYLEKTYSLYGGIPTKGMHAHEGGLRLILHAIATAAAKHALAIEPLLSLSIDFYARVWVRVRRSPIDVKFLAGKTMIVYNCDTSGCGAWSTQYLARNSVTTSKDGTPFHKHHPALNTTDKHCEHCGSKTHLSGPMWGGPLHNPWFIGRVLSLLNEVDDEIYMTKKRIEGMLTSALDELEVISAFDEIEAQEDTKPTVKHHPVAPTNGYVPDEPDDSVKGRRTDMTTRPKRSGLIPTVPASLIDPHPFAMHASQLARAVKAIAPSEALIKGALRHLGYVATRSHARPGMIKTQAPWSVVWEIMREFVRTKAPVKEGVHKEGSSGYRLLYGSSTSAAPQTVGGEAELQTQDGGTSVGAAQGEQKRIEVVFDERLGKDRPGKRLLRYQVNPRANWGPMSRARG